MSIVIVVIAIIVNWWLAAAFIQLLLSFFHVAPLAAYKLAAGLMTALVAVGFTPAADIVLKTITGCRRPFQSEAEQFAPLFAQVCQAASLNPGDFDLRVVEDKFPGAFALGNKTIAVSRGLLSSGSDDEILGALAHETGHIFYGDALRGKLFLIVSLAGQAILGISALIGHFLAWLGRIPLPFAKWIFSALGLILSLLVIVVQGMVVLPLLIGQYSSLRQADFRADRFATEIGFGDGLKTFLVRILDINGQPTGLWGLLWRLNPKTGDRIRRLEEKEI